MTNYLWTLYGSERAIRMIAQAGFDAIDWSVYDANAASALVRFSDYREKALEIRHMAEDCGMTVNQCHAPFRFDFASEAGFADAFEMVTRCIEAAAIMGAGTIVVHPLHFRRYRQNQALVYKENLAYFRSLLSCAEESGIVLCAENMWQWNDAHTAVAADACAFPEELSSLIDEIGSEHFAACLDLGHAEVTGRETQCTTADFIRRLGGKRLRALHVHDSDGQSDLHTAPYIGKIDWDGVLTALKEIGYTGDFTFEADPFLEAYPRDFLPTALRFLHDTGRTLLQNFLPRDDS